MMNVDELIRNARARLNERTPRIEIPITSRLGATAAARTNSIARAFQSPPGTPNSTPATGLRSTSRSLSQYTQEQLTRIRQFQDAFEGFGMSAPQVLAGMIYQDPWSGKRRKIPSNGRQLDALAERVASKISGPAPRRTPARRAPDRDRAASLLQRFTRSQLANRLTDAQRTQLEVDRNLAMLSTSMQDRYFEFIDRKRFILPLKWILHENLGLLLEQQLNYTPSQHHLGAILQTINATIDARLQEIPYSRLSMHIRLESIFAHAKVTISKTNKNGKAVETSEFTWEADPFALTMHEVAQLKTREEIRLHARAFKNQNDQYNPTALNKGFYEFGVVTAGAKELDNSTARLVIDKGNPEDVQQVKTKVAEILALVTSTNNPQYSARRFVGLLSFDVDTYPINAVRQQGSSYVKLPQKFGGGSKGLINPENKTDNKCFLWASLMHFANADGAKKQERTSTLKRYESMITWPEEVKFPFDCTDIPRLEEANPTLTWNVFSLEQVKRSSEDHHEHPEDTDEFKYPIVPIHTTTPEKYRERTLINILAYEDHYVFVKDLDKLLSERAHNCAHCPICTRRFRTKAIRDQHTAQCNANWRHLFQPWTLDEIKSQARTPQELKRTETDITYSQDTSVVWKPVVAVADFEAVNTQVNGETHQKAQSVSLKFDFQDGMDAPDMDCSFMGPDAGVRFLHALLDATPKIRDACSRYKDDFSKVTAADREHFEASETCHFCGEAAFASSAEIARAEAEYELKSKLAPEEKDELKRALEEVRAKRKVLDHCHCTGLYRGAAHSRCNLKHGTPSLISSIPVYFHNMSYDSQLIMQALSDVSVQARIKEHKVRMNAMVINSERFKTLEIGAFRILDSMTFLGGSLAESLKNLPSEDKHSLRRAANEHAERFGKDPDAVFEAFKHKQVFPYEFDWHQHLDEPISADPQFFGSKLSEGYGKTDEELEERLEAEQKELEESLPERMSRLQEATGIVTWRDLHDLYLSIDVCGLQDCMRAFRKTSMNTYGLDPAYCISNSQFAWKAMLKLTGVSLESIPTSDLYEHAESGLRGGMSMARNRIARANHPDLPEYDPAKEFSAIHDFDANALYASVMSWKLPTGGYKDVDPERFDANDPRYGGLPTRPNQPCEEWQGDVGALVTVDIDYPDRLHDLHSDYPLLPEVMEVPDEMLSPMQRGKRAVKTTKLIAHLGSRKNYTLNVTMLKFALAQGLELTKVHRVVEFDQSPWLRPWVDLNTRLRKQGKNPFEEGYFKLMVNACFGKTMERIYHHTQARFIDNRAAFTRAMTSHRALTYKPIAPEFALVTMSKREYVRDKPIFVGASILDFSKLWMYTFLYNVVYPTFGPKNARLLGTDTDSLIMNFRAPSHEAYLEKMLSIRDEWLDMSKFPEGHPLFTDANRKTPGFFKDELGDNLAIAVAFVRAKTYSIKTLKSLEDELEDVHRAKGAPSRCVQNSLTHDDYETTILESSSVSAQYHDLQYKNHNIVFSRRVKKVLDWVDDKGYHLSAERTIALNHWRIRAGALAAAMD